MKIYEALAYQNLYGRLKDEILNIKLAYKLNKINLRLVEEVEFYETSLQKILNQYAQKNEDGSYVQNESKTGILIEPEYLEICHKKINELQSIDIDISDIYFTLEELSELKITPAELSCLNSLIKE